MNPEMTNQSIQTQPTGSTPNRDKDNRWYFDYQSLYWEIKARLMGGWITIDKNDQYVIASPADARPMMNSKGVEETMTIVNGFVTKIQALSVYDEERIFILCKDLYAKLAIFYYVNMEGFDLDPARASVVIRMIADLFESNLRKSMNGISLRLISNTESYAGTAQQPQKKVLGII